MEEERSERDGESKCKCSTRKKEEDEETEFTLHAHFYTLFRNPLRTWAALTERERGIRMVFSRITVK